MRADLSLITNAEVMAAVVAAVGAAEALPLERVAAMFRALADGESLSVDAQSSSLCRKDRRWAAAVAIALHSRLGEAGAERAIAFMAQPGNVTRVLVACAGATVDIPSVVGRASVTR